MSYHVYTESVLRQKWDDATRTYSEYDETGAILPGFPRPYTAEENAAADAQVAAAQAAADLAALRAAVKLIITDLQAEKTRCDAVIAKSNASITGGDTKDVARAGKRIADAAIDLARLFQTIA